MGVASPYGRLILVVGPSGVGKDTLIDGARAWLADDPRFAFVQRDITRPREAGGENHSAVSIETFLQRRSSGEYALSWGAHQLYYGIPKSIEALFPQGVSAIVNGSRSVIGDARKGFRGCTIISIRAKTETLRKRLMTRARETAEQIDQRLQRATAFTVEGPDVIEVWNDGTPEEGVTRFIDAVMAERSVVTA